MSARPKAKAELVQRIGQLAAETGSSPEDLAVALEECRSGLGPLRDLIDAGIQDGGAADGETFLRELLEETKVQAGQRALRAATSCCAGHKPIFGRFAANPGRQPGPRGELH